METKEQFVAVVENGATKTIDLAADEVERLHQTIQQIGAPQAFAQWRFPWRVLWYGDKGCLPEWAKV